MGGKSSGGGTSQTQVQIPPWISAILKPLLSGSASKLQTFQNQGWDVLQGNTPQTGVSLEELQTGGLGGASGGAGFPGGPVQKYPQDPTLDPRTLAGGGGGGVL